MTIPSSTYRIQFRNGMTFDRATALIPYLKRLGISHLYASPVFTATAGSTHGYDIIDPNEIDPAIGGRHGFEAMANSLHAAGLGLIIDIVPNHMAASLENSWWRSVVEWGTESPFSDYFDINWRRRLTLPILGQPLDKVIEAGDLKFALDAAAGALTIAYFDNLIPLHPATYAGLPLPAEILERAVAATPENAATFHKSLRDLFAREGVTASLQTALDHLSGDREALQRVLDRQSWQLLYWLDAPNELSYRRFFEVTGLAGLRVEDEKVFEDSHRLILDLVRSGQVDGLRIDHIDGLVDPKAYLDRLRQEVGPDTYIVAEKILAADEQLPSDWPISGTTGYEFITALSNALVDTRGLDRLDLAYADVTGQRLNFQDGARQAKQQLIAANLAVEANNLLKLALDIAGTQREDGPSEKAIQDALMEILIAFPVYRTYGTKNGLDDANLCLWNNVIISVRELRQPPDPRALAFLDRVFRGETPTADLEIAAEFRRRLQQLTGPLTAKAIEDTMFYRFNRLLGLNEVGGEVDGGDFGLDRFHQLMIERIATQPHGLSATSTHDTKRGEDARARLYAISEAPDVWEAAVRRWREINKSRVRHLSDGPAPDAETEWMLYQALAGAWPAGLESGHQLPTDFEARFLGYVEKALREAKLRTDWSAVNEPYETAVKNYARSLLSSENSAFQLDFRRTLRPFIRAGLFNGLSQTLIKLSAPGVPDIYQGSEGLDFSLVDPDNRRMPDLPRLTRHLMTSETSTNEAALSSGVLKQQIIARTLRYRRENAALLRDGNYEPLQARGAGSEHVIAFLRRLGDQFVIVLAPRLVFYLGDDEWSCADFWGDTAVLLPASCRGQGMRNVILENEIDAGREFPLAAILDRLPVALLANS
ncbi:malto-oligosyltrehalose synthase [Rhizobium sp. BK376]|uniref:malto-oligosyltrehalose synthase n=1 Tax=Rhizobium sp. BK376 TaxID=2512149 RepID=UPI001043CFBE|nr:malto-oligosyltrehalose synthase [Rhizobium sp. BK376]TCR80076.1 maltooligosyl trehalose synthase [Rhizobium sp. BK376]